MPQLWGRYRLSWDILDPIWQLLEKIEEVQRVSWGSATGED